jgi:Na+/melibiose symporter-like transporter
MANYQATPQPAADPGNTLGLVGLILAIIPCTSTIGLVLSIVGYIQSRRAGFQNSKALAGIIIGIVWIALGIIAQVTGIIAGFFQS